MRKKIKSLSKSSKSSKNLRRKTTKQMKPRHNKRTKKAAKKAGFFSSTRINFDDAYTYLNQLSETYNLYKYILDNCQINTRSTNRDGTNLILDLNIIGKVGTRHYITDIRYTGKDIIFNYNEPLYVRREKIRSHWWEISDTDKLKSFQDYQKYQELLVIIEDCLTKLQQNITNYNILKEAIEKSKIPKIIKTMRTPVSEAISQGRKTHLNQTLVMSNINTNQYYENYLSKIKQDEKNINMNNIEFLEKCIDISNELSLPHREFQKKSIGLPVGKGGGNLFVEFGCLKNILNFDKKIMLNIKYDIEYIINKVNKFFGEDLDISFKKKNMQDYFRKNKTGYAPVNYNTKRPGGRYRFIQDMHEQDLQNAFANNNTGLKIIDPETLRQKGIYRRGKQQSNNEEFFDALSSSDSNEFFDAKSGNE